MDSQGSDNIGNTEKGGKEDSAQLFERTELKSLYKCPFCFPIVAIVDGHMKQTEHNSSKFYELRKTEEKSVSNSIILLTSCHHLTWSFRVADDSENTSEGLDDGGKLTESIESESEAVDSEIEKTCSKRLPSKKRLEGRTSIRHKCQVCSKSFGRQGSLNNHIRTHTGERPYKCTVCQKSFGQQGNLYYHIRTHTGKRPYKCTLCQKSFGKLGNLNNHIRTHTGERPYHCQLCSKSFSQQGNLKVHVRTHTNKRRHRYQYYKKTHDTSIYHIKTYMTRRLMNVNASEMSLHA